jgi:hypothetical protein
MFFLILRVVILYGAFNADAAPGTNSMENSTSFCGGNYEIFAGNTPEIVATSSTCSIPLLPQHPYLYR